ncbi:hypothetical protein LEP1GSC051_0343 [Leptospira sp. P2653]|nr:hypothetical protein LEP1GSC051_0343 [Leptospira sp. P2653]
MSRLSLQYSRWDSPLLENDSNSFGQSIVVFYIKRSLADFLR